MRRDFDIVRRLLLEVEGYGPDVVDKTFSELDDDSPEDVYHALLLVEAGYLDGKIQGRGGGIKVIWVDGLTWKGHDFLDAIKDDTIWRRTKDRIVSTVGTASAEVVKAVAEGITKGMLFPGQ